MDLKEYIRKCGKSANEHGWFITWETYPQYLLATIDELTDSFESGWRDNNKDKAFEEICDCLVRLFHLAYDLKIPVEDILKRVMEENEKRPYKHNHVNI